MSEDPESKATPDETTKKASDKFYSIADQQAQVEYTQARRAAQWVPFLLPHVRSGMRLLDCGWLPQNRRNAPTMRIPTAVALFAYAHASAARTFSYSASTCVRTISGRVPAFGTSAITKSAK